MKIFEKTFLYEQDNDCCDSGNLGQTLTVQTQDGGGGNYIILSTERWAIDDIDQFCAELKKVLEGME